MAIAQGHEAKLIEYIELGDRSGHNQSTASKSGITRNAHPYALLLWSLRERDCHHEPSVVPNIDLTPNLLNERPNKAVAERSLPKTRHPDTITPDDQFNPS